MSAQAPYPIGTPGTPWGDGEKTQWLAMQKVKRSYAHEVGTKIDALRSRFDVTQYGELSIAPERYPLFALRTPSWQAGRPVALVTGGVHGYETSGVQGALRFLETEALRYADHFNLVVAPCVSPWGYETINRWNPAAMDPNRSFATNTKCEEAAALMRFLASIDGPFFMHIDLHETTDTDNSEFRPALSARDASEQKNWHIPDGFYTVDNSENPSLAFQTAIIDAVRRVTHIAPADSQGTIIGSAVLDEGVIEYAAATLGLCMGTTDARYVTTTEVYPDSPKVDNENCTQAQVAAVLGGLEFVKQAAD